MLNGKSRSQIPIEEQETLPLIDNKELIPDTMKKNLVQKVISQTFQSTAHLANLLPTGTVLTFQLLSPIFTNLGHCDPVSRSMTAVLLFLCGLSSFALSFTDSFRDKKGNVCYGFATRTGLWVIDGSGTLPPELTDQYQLRFIDFLHAFMSLVVFSAITLFDQNVVNCFYPSPSDEAKEVLTGLPVAIGIVSSMLFVVFPTTRHGIGFPVSIDHWAFRYSIFMGLTNCVGTIYLHVVGNVLKRVFVIGFSIIAFVKFKKLLGPLQVTRYQLK